MKEKLLVYILILLVIQIISKQTDTYRYIENDIENYLLPKPERIYKGEKTIEIKADETEIHFIQEQLDSGSYQEKNQEFLKEIKKLYLEIFKGENKSKIKQLKDSTGIEEPIDGKIF